MEYTILVRFVRDFEADEAVLNEKGKSATPIELARQMALELQACYDMDGSLAGRFQVESVNVDGTVHQIG